MPKQLSNIKKQVEKLKKSTPVSASSMQRITESVDQLATSINSLIGMFKEAGEEIKFEEKEEDIVEERLIPLEAKVDTLIEQNKKIAEGIVALADMLKGKEAKPPVKAVIRPLRPLPPMKPRQVSPPSSLPPLMKLPPKGFPPPMPPKIPPAPRFEEFKGGKELPPLPPPPFPLEKEKKKKKFGLF